jgi:hypothetical protein
MSDTPFATTDDVEVAWRPLSNEELSRASALIDRASRKIRRRWADVDDRIEAETLDALAVADVVAEMVQVAMTQTPGVSQTNEGAGPFSQAVTYTNPNSRLYFTDDMIEVFEGRSLGSKMGWLA